ncbi:MAG: Wzz/FepE/Etk N-terminal domain-containing protein [Thermanaeromonas sp.]|uniref:Wzz/FepE/Etk N-terminal domain-containing protein n=1 Tax=Thermanaeromonas sp. TaxID=2003697 RepID=UPI00243AB6FF|nr:Wzz/FepE/Etk N-terminal domain-containing protein [Thermanaeromonas sp.]MCG0279049.1 Wzz/FepE/Etk N-terminal domain-containing protein [Thermanaeromonas sp.]
MEVPTINGSYNNEEEIDLKELLYTLWNHRRSIIAITLLAVLVSIAISFILPPAYRVEALIELDKTDAQSLKPNEGKEILESRVLLTRALEQLSLDLDPLSFKQRADIIKDTGYIKFSLEGRDPGQVKLVAEKVVNLFLEERNKVYRERRAPLEENLRKLESDLEQYQATRGKIAQIISTLENSSLSDVEKKLYALQLAQLSSAQAQEKVGLIAQYLSLQEKLAALHPARVVDSVSEPLKVKPRLALNTAVSLVLGLMVGIFAALVRNWWTYSKQATNARPQE